MGQGKMMSGRDYHLSIVNWACSSSTLHKLHASKRIYARLLEKLGFAARPEGEGRGAECRPCLTEMTGNIHPTKNFVLRTIMHACSCRPNGRC